MSARTRPRAVTREEWNGWYDRMQTCHSSTIGWLVELFTLIYEARTGQQWLETPALPTPRRVQ
jgi:hypothetical protein